MLPYKFEAGTPDISGAIGLHAALDYIESIGFDAIGAHETRPARLRTQVLDAIDGVRLIGNRAVQGTASCRSSWTASIPTTSGRSWIARGSAIRTGLTARSR